MKNKFLLTFIICLALQGCSAEDLSGTANNLLVLSLAIVLSTPLIAKLIVNGKGLTVFATIAISSLVLVAGLVAAVETGGDGITAFIKNWAQEIYALIRSFISGFKI